MDIAAMGIPATDTTYQVFQCTWWASVRRVHTGLESPWTLTWRWDVDAGCVHRHQRAARRRVHDPRR